MLLALSASCLQSQSGPAVSLSTGFKIGSPLNEPSGANSLFSTFIQGRWTGGPTVEIHLPHSLSVEFDALYRNFREHQSFPFQLDQHSNAYTYTGTQKTGAWDLPLLLKYRFRIGPISPFVSAGHFWTRETRESSFGYSCAGPQGSCEPEGYPAAPLGLGSSRSSAVHRGIVGGVGVEFRSSRVIIAPELRFSRPTNGTLHDSRFTALIGFTFGKRR